METMPWYDYYIQWLTSGFAIPLWILGLLDIFTFISPRFLPRFIRGTIENASEQMKGIFGLVRKVATIVLAIVILVNLAAIPYQMYRDNQKQITETLVKKQFQIDDLQKQLSSITSLTFTQLPIKDEHINAPDTREIIVTITPDFNPAYLGTIPYVIENIDLFNHVQEFVKITVNPVSAEFKLTYIDQAVLPPSVLIVNKYSGTDEIIIMINDIAPGGKMTIDFPIYSMNNDPAIRGTAKLSAEILYKGVLP